MKLKRILAVAMATTMVMGMSLTAFAEDGSTGDGTSEGTVNKNIVDVVLPANTTGAQSPFSYVMDPERLIRATVEDNAKYEGYTFPEAAGDTGVYFKNGTEYKNQSETLQIVNKGAVKQKVSVTIEKVASTDDIALATGKGASDLISGDDPLLYLALVCAGQTKVVGASAQTVDVVVPGTDSNYQVKLKADKSGYEYVKKATLTDWKGIELYVEGAVGNKVIGAKTAPSLKVTWGFANTTDAEASTGLVDVEDASAPSIATTTYTMTANTPIDITVNLGSGDKAATKVAKVMDPTGAYDYLAGGYATYDTSQNKLTLKATMVNACMGANVGSCKIVFDDEAATTIVVTLNQ